MRFDVGQFMFIWFLASIGFSAFMIWLFYYCIKCGVRDGINEARPRTQWRDVVSRSKSDDGLPQMHVD